METKEERAEAFVRKGPVEMAREHIELEDTVSRFVRYADQYPEDISGPLRDDFLPQLRKAVTS